MSKPLKKFSTQADENLLEEVKVLAKSEGKQFQVLVNEAFADLIEKRKQTKPRKHIITHFEESLNVYDSLYENLAK